MQQKLYLKESTYGNTFCKRPYFGLKKGIYYNIKGHLLKRKRCPLGIKDVNY